MVREDITIIKKAPTTTFYWLKEAAYLHFHISDIIKTLCYEIGTLPKDHRGWAGGWLAKILKAACPF